jgi:hypothetical protein
MIRLLQIYDYGFVMSCGKSKHIWSTYSKLLRYVPKKISKYLCQDIPIFNVHR